MESTLRQRDDRIAHLEADVAALRHLLAASPESSTEGEAPDLAAVKAAKRRRIAAMGLHVVREAG